MPYDTNYLTTIPDLTDLPNYVDDVDDVEAKVVNDPKVELLACLTELGTLPKGSTASVKARLDVSLNDDGSLKSTLSPTFVNVSLTNLTVSGLIKGEGKHLRFTIIDPATTYDKDTQVCVWVKVDAAITITNLEVTCDADPGTEVQGDVKWADAFIGLAGATVINDFDTTNGVRSDSSITAGSVASGKSIYIEFDAKPDTNITQLSFDITYDYD